MNDTEDAKRDRHPRLSAVEHARRQRLIAKLTREEVKSAKEQGGRAGEQMLTAVQSALCNVLERGAVGEGDRVALEYLRDCLREHFEGVPLPRALRVARGKGASPTNDSLMPFRYLAVAHELNKQMANSQSPDVCLAIKKAAHREKVSASTIRRAWERMGGLKYYKARVMPK